MAKILKLLYEDDVKVRQPSPLALSQAIDATAPRRMHHNCLGYPGVGNLASVPARPDPGGTRA
jgi:hypothetical protein